MLKTPTTKDIDARSEQLTDGFVKHVQDFRKAMKSKNGKQVEPSGVIDIRKVYEGWSIQKIAGLQIMVEYLEELVHQLASGVKRKS